MKLYKKIIKKSLSSLPVWYLNKLFETDKRKMLFIIGHMRSGSSLLLHILNSNPKIIGFGEMHLRYFSKKDFGQAALRTYLSFKQLPTREYYVLDKILHTKLLKKQNLLNEAKSIFIIRNPGEAMSSMLNLSDNKASNNPENALIYYTERLRWITNSVDSLNPSEWTFTTYKELTQNPFEAFYKIEKLLDLEKSLSCNYDKIWSTGKPIMGDPGSKIHKGQIIKNTSKDIDHRVLPYLNEAQLEYDICLSKLSKKQ